jgi:hypothetical protein
MWASNMVQISDNSEHSSDNDENKVAKSPSSFDYRVSLFNTEVNLPNALLRRE